MKKKGLVYRMTMILGIGVIAMQCCGELIYSKYFKSDRDLELNDVLLRFSYNKNRKEKSKICLADLTKKIR